MSEGVPVCRCVHRIGEKCDHPHCMERARGESEQHRKGDVERVAGLLAKLYMTPEEARSMADLVIARGRVGVYAEMATELLNGPDVVSVEALAELLRHTARRSFQWGAWYMANDLKQPIAHGYVSRLVPGIEPNFDPRRGPGGDG